MDGPSAIDLLCIQGLNLNPSVCMSESERTPGYLNRSQVPPNASLPSRIANDLSGQLFCKLYPAAMPDIPAPTIIISLCIYLTSQLLQYLWLL